MEVVGSNPAVPTNFKGLSAAHFLRYFRCQVRRRPAIVVSREHGQRERDAVGWGIFGGKSQLKVKVTTGRLEIERDGEVDTRSASSGRANSRSVWRLSDAWRGDR